jgi:hypothetical protein
MLVLSASPLYAQEPLTNESIVKLVKAGLSEDMIVSMVNAQPAKYSLGADDIVALKTAGVSEKIIAAMVTKAPAPAPTAAPAPAEPSTPPPLRSIGRIYIDKMPNDLDQFIRAEIGKQLKNRMAVVLKEEDADAVMTGTGENRTGTGAAITGRYLGLHDNATGSVSIVDKQRRVVIWSSEAGDRSLLFGVMKRGGPRKVADRLVSKLKKDLGRK